MVPRPVGRQRLVRIAVEVLALDPRPAIYGVDLIQPTSCGERELPHASWNISKYRNTAESDQRRRAGRRSRRPAEPILVQARARFSSISELIIDVQAYAPAVPRRSAVPIPHQLQVRGDSPVSAGTRLLPPRVIRAVAQRDRAAPGEVVQYRGRCRAASCYPRTSDCSSPWSASLRMRSLRRPRLRRAGSIPMGERPRAGSSASSG